MAHFLSSEKAIIEIFDLRQIEQSVKGTIPGSNGKTASTSLGDFSIMDSLETTLNGTQLDVLEKAMTTEFQYGGELKKFQSFDGINTNAMKKQFEVQFNPSDLQIEGYGGGRIASTAYNNAEDKDKGTSANIVMMPMPVYVKMSVKLLFDRMDPSDAFLSSKTNVTVSSGVKALTQAVTNAATKTKLTVQEEVEGLIAALRSPYTRCITFNWGDMSYQGVLNRVASQYTMFDSAGVPVRAVVQLSLICADEKVSPKSLGFWQEAYNGAFGAGSSSLVSAGQKVGSLLNIKR